MLQNRLAAATQIAAVPVIMATTAHPIALGVVRGPVTIVLGATYVATAIVALACPTNDRASEWVAAVGVAWWLLRITTLLVYGITSADAISWAGIAIQAQTAAFVLLFYWRSIGRASMLRRIDWIRDGVGHAA